MRNKGVFWGLFASLLICSSVFATADSLRVIRSGFLIKTASPIVTNLTVEGTTAHTGVVTFSSAYLPKYVVLDSNATTANAAIANVFITTGNSGATAINTISGGTIGQKVTFVGGSATNSSTMADSGTLKLTTSMTLGANDTITLICVDGTNWAEVSRADN